MAALSIISRPAGISPSPDDPRDGATGALDVVEAGQQDLGALGARQQAHGYLGHDAQHALRADHQREQIQTRGIQCLAAEAHHLAVEGDDFQAGYVMHCQPVLQAVHAAGVLCDIAANGTGDLRGRVRCIVQAVGCRGLGDREVAHPGLDDGAAVVDVHLQDAVEPRHRQKNAEFAGAMPLPTDPCLHRVG